MGNNIKGISICLLTAMIWGMGFIIQYIGGSSIGVLYFSIGRIIVGVSVLFVLILVSNFIKTKKWHFWNETDDPHSLIKVSLITGLILSIAILVQQNGVLRTQSAKAGLITSLDMVCVPIILWLVDKRKLKKLTWLFIFTAVVGVIFLNAGSISGINIGDILCFIAMIFFSIDIVLIDKIAPKLDALKFSMFRFIVVGIVSLVLAIFFANPDDLSRLHIALPAILASGVFVMGLGYTGQIIGQKLTTPVIATVTLGLEGVFATIFGFLILHQNLTLMQMIGVAVILVSTIMVQITDNSNV